LVIGFTELLQNVTANDYDSLTELHTPKITVTTADIKSSHFAMSSSVVAWRRISIVSSVSVLTFLRAADYLATNSLLQLSTLKVKVKITLRLAVYRQSVRHVVKTLQPRDQRFFLQLKPFGH
jgi:hypothetical protein